MKLKKEFSHIGKGKIWRMIIDSDNLIVEERNTESKEVFFSCFNIAYFKKVFKSIQMDEKFWSGIETVYKGIIYFHTYTRPNMPTHKEIIAFDIASKSRLWSSEEYVYLFPHHNKIIAYKQLFESREFVALDYYTGKLVENYGEDFEKINQLKYESEEEISYDGYLFPEFYKEEFQLNNNVNKQLQIVKNKYANAVEIQLLEKNNHLFLTLHTKNKKDNFSQIFIAVDNDKQKIIAEEEVVNDTKLFLPDSFFVKDDLLFLIKEKEELFIYSIKD